MSKVSEHEIAFLTPCCDKGRGLLQDHRWGSPKNPSAMFVLIPSSGFPHVLAISEVHSTKCHLWYLFFFCDLAVDKLQAVVTGAQRTSTGQGVGWDRGAAEHQVSIIQLARLRSTDTDLMVLLS